MRFVLSLALLSDLYNGCSSAIEELGRRVGSCPHPPSDFARSLSGSPPREMRIILDARGKSESIEVGQVMGDGASALASISTNG
jgi:hypothetical protein